MKFYNNADELIKKELPRSIRAQLYPFFLSGARAFHEVIQSNSTLFTSTFLTNIKGWLFNYLIFRQFEEDMLSENFPFKVQAVKVNNFNYKSLNLVRQNVIINIGKAKDKDALPNRSWYRVKQCRKNKFKAKQLFYDTNTKNNLIVKPEPYYLFLTYGTRNNDIEFVNLLVPNENMTGYLKKIELGSEFSLIKNNDILIQQAEKRITSLKADVLKQLNLLKGEGNES
ncbi:hypothetical protein BR63_05585 [Thermanaerosceptrum fracticalcis]|uniref:Uncharacterized protein n=1 Tax=Thermanaerosceptrum fracticalcis TaxID=1712410 RepID=A0A7G6E176_THEFR|nr:hypothetical protein [Thermanaerosceptrum fracticalcis]QNB45830.1 hypothetical protein BR63_05585 [Thermanaerosceptrum fracticalcis]